MKNRANHPLALILTLWACVASGWAAGPTVSNVRSGQRPGTQLVDIDYDLANPDTATLTVSVAVSDNGGASYTLPATSFTGAVGIGVTPGTGKRITWNAGVDWPNKFSANVRFRVTASDDTVPPAPGGMALIPASSFQMGDMFREGDSDERPVHSVFVAALYMDKHEVTKALWDEVKNWNGGNGYGFDGSGDGKAANHPVQTVSWFDVVKWCNARSQKEGRVPAYYTDMALTQVYKTGQVAPYVKWAAGYRLPTEAEWEKAARGGSSGRRFPWSDADADTITHSRANYYSSSGFSYDVSPTRGGHPTYQVDLAPYTSPVGAFAANGYGLYDMAGNVWEWCWDWYGSYSSGSQTDPRGPASGLYRVFRGGSWDGGAIVCRSAFRGNYVTPGVRDDGVGLRCVLLPGQP